MEELKYGQLTGKILKSFYDVYNNLGVGLSEDIYTQALQIGFEYQDLSVETNRIIKIKYKNKEVGKLKLGMIVSNRILVKVKVAQTLETYDETSFLTELEHSNLTIGLILLFGSAPFQKRVYNPKVLD